MKRKKNNRWWHRRYLRHQKKINGYARKHLCPREERDAIRVFHPEEYRRYLKQGPCPDCPVNGFCDTPCQVYLRWYDDRMTLLRQLLTGGETLGA